VDWRFNSDSKSPSLSGVSALASAASRESRSSASMRVVASVRVSTAKQAEEGLGLEVLRAQRADGYRLRRAARWSAKTVGRALGRGGDLPTTQ
jgi:hypothetical protein